MRQNKKGIRKMEIINENFLHEELAEQNVNFNDFEDNEPCDNNGVYTINNPGGLEWDPVSKFIPQSDKYAIEQLKRSISLKGQLEPIEMLNGKLLNGRARAQACAELGIGLLAIDLPKDTNPRQYLAAKNLEMRHLSLSQKTATAVLMTDEMENMTTEEKVVYASKVVNASVCKIYNCMKIRGISEDAFWAIFNGKLNINQAERQFGLK